MGRLIVGSINQKSSRVDDAIGVKYRFDGFHIINLVWVRRLDMAFYHANAMFSR